MRFSENLSNKCKFAYNLTRITITLHAHLFTFMKVSRWILLRMRNVSEKNCAQNDNAFFFMFSGFSLKILPFMRYGRAGKATADNIIRRMRFACCVTMATNTHTHTEYVILIRILRPERLRERDPMLLYTSITCFIYINRQCWSVSTNSDQLHVNCTLITATSSSQ
jgi:hypothetical protein